MRFRRQVKAFLAERKAAKEAAERGDTETVTVGDGPPGLPPVIDGRDVGEATAEPEEEEEEEEEKLAEPELIVTGDRVDFLMMGAPADEGRKAMVLSVDSDWNPPQIVIQFEDSAGKKTVRGFGSLTKCAPPPVKIHRSQEEELEHRARQVRPRPRPRRSWLRPLQSRGPGAGARGARDSAVVLQLQP